MHNPWRVRCGAIFAASTIVLLTIRSSEFGVSLTRWNSSPPWAFSADGHGLRVKWWDESGRASPAPDHWSFGDSDFGICFYFLGTHHAAGTFPLHGAMYEFILSIWWLIAFFAIAAALLLAVPIRKAWSRRRDLRVAGALAVFTAVFAINCLTSLAISLWDMAAQGDFSALRPGWRIATLMTAVLLTMLTWEPRPPAALAPECKGCGYDLTGNVSGCCPECGRATGRPLDSIARRL